ncbi:MAG: TonB-dependent receptor plug domain-containing protein, partial [Rhodothermales bacterium]
MYVKRFAFLLLILPLFLRPARAQEVLDTIVVVLPTITIDATRDTETTGTAPFAVSVLYRSKEDLAYEPATSLDGVLRSLPGVWITDRGHSATGERLTVRGMGARAAFGVRGVQVLLDGIPLTMPDGQAVLEVVDPAMLRRAELLRSPASVFWGNGSGAVLFLSSGEADADPGLRVRGMAGGHGQRQVLLDGSTTFGAHHLKAYASNTVQDGFRGYSGGSLTRGGAIARFRMGPRTRLRAMAAAVLQDTENPGTLTREEFETDPRLPRALFVNTRSGKVSSQAQAGAMLEHFSSIGDISATVFGISRLLDNPLPFAYIDLGRTAGGARLSIQNRSGRLQWGAGLDAGLQHDDRENRENVDGERGPELTLHQLEDVTSSGAFAYARYMLAPGLRASGGIRRSYVRFEMEDR